MIALPSLKQLGYLCAVAKTRHFGRAAASCHVSQSTLSAAINDMEEYLGTKLVERNNKRVYLTAIGEEVVRRSQSILTNVSDLVTLCRASGDPFNSELRLGVIPTIAPFLLPALLSGLRNDYPDFRLSIREDLSKPLVERLYNGELDVLLLALPYPSQGTDILHLFHDDFLFVCPDKHPLAGARKIHLDDLNGQDVLLLEDGHCLRDHALEACKLDGKKLSTPYQATSLNTLVQMVANGMGVTLLPRMAVDAQLLAGIQVKIKPFVEKNIRRSIGLMWRNTSPRADEFRLLGERIQQQQASRT